MDNIYPFELPVRVEVNPMGASKGETDNIFIVDATGSAIFIVAKHPVWTYLEQGRLPIANKIAELINKEMS